MARSSASNPSQRMLSVGETVRHALTGVLQRGEIQDPVLDGKIVTVSEVRMSPDLKVATAYVTVLGETETKPFVDALKRNVRFIRGRVTPALKHMKTMPEFRFQTDTSFDNFAKIDSILRRPEVRQDIDGDDTPTDSGER